MRVTSALQVCALLGGLWLWPGWSSQTQADLLTVDNYSFEEDFAPDGSFPTFVPTGWERYDPHNLFPLAGNAVGVLNPTGTTFFSSVPDGNNVALIYMEGSIDAGEAGLTQVLTDTLQANTRYTLTVEVGNIASGTGLPPYDQFYDLDGFPGYQVQLLAGGTVLVMDDNSLFGSIAEGTFETSEISFTTGDTHAMLGQSLEIRLINLNQTDVVGDPGIEVDFDNIRLDATAVPEPGSFLILVGVTLSLFFGLSRRKPEKKTQPVLARKSGG